MNKAAKFLAALTALVTLTSLASCKKNKNNSSSEIVETTQSTAAETSTAAAETTSAEVTTENAVPEMTAPTGESTEFASEDDIIKLNISRENYIELLNEKNIQFNLSDFPLGDIPLPDGNVIQKVCFVGDKTVILSGLQSGGTEIGVFDTASGTYKKNSTIIRGDYSGNSTFVLQDRYLFMYSSYYSDRDSCGIAAVFDAQTDEVKVLDDFKMAYQTIHAAPLGDDSIAVFYYEPVTEDWIIRSLSVSGESKELFRHSPSNASEDYPIALSSSGNEAALFVGTKNNEKAKKSYTRILWISENGEVTKEEGIDFFNLYENSVNQPYIIENVTIDGDIYYVNATYYHTTGCYAMKREGDTFRLIMPSSFKFDGITQYHSNSGSTVYFGTGQETHIFGMDFANKNFVQYNVFSGETPVTKENIFVNKNNDMFTVYRDKSTNKYKYQIIKNISANPSGQPEMFRCYSPKEQYDMRMQYADTPEKKQEAKKQLKDEEIALANQDARWKFIFAEKYYAQLS